MNKKIKAVISVLLIAVMALSLCACGDKGGENKPSATQNPGSTAAPGASSSEYVYSAEYKTINNENGGWIGLGAYNDEGFYYSTQEIVGNNIPEGVIPEWEDQYAVWETVIYHVDYSGNLTKLEAYKPIKKDTEHEQDSYINNMLAMDNGDLILYEEYSETWSDAPEGTELYSDVWYQYYRSAREYYIRIVDGKTGEETKCTRLLIPEEIASPTDGTYFWPYGVTCDNEGHYVMASETKVLGFDGEGNMICCFDMDTWTDSVIRLADGRAAVTTWGEKGIVANVVDVNNGRFGEKIELPSSAYGAISGNGDFDFYYNNGINFCGYNSETKEQKTIFNWINCDVNNDTMSGFGILSDGSVIGVTNTWDKNYENCTNEIVTIKSVPADTLPAKQNITLATQYLSYDLRDDIISFNRSNDRCRIIVNDYSQFNTEEDYSAGLQKLNTEILAGNVPDIIDLSGLPYERYAAKGILEDLYPFIDADKELSREDFFPNILQALEQDGKLCSTCSSFSIRTFLGASSLVGDKPGWTYDQLEAAYAQMPEDCRIFDYYFTRYDVLGTGLAMDIDSYCDWSTGQCSFDSDGFKKLLRFAASFPAEFSWENYEYSPADEPYTLVAQGKQMLLSVYMSDLSEAGLYDAMFGEQGCTYIGFPTVSGTGNMINMNSGFAMTTACADKDGAWQFLRTFFTEDYQNEMYGIPTNLAAYRQQEKDAMTPSYRQTTEIDANGNITYRDELDEDGNKIKIARGSYYLSNSELIEFYELSQEQADKLYELVSTTTKFESSDTGIYDIVKEQVEAFFQGQKSVDEVAKLIQSKMNIYINEQR